MTPSMSQPANPYDNAVCESFMKTLKQEEIYCKTYVLFAFIGVHPRPVSFLAMSFSISSESIFGKNGFCRNPTRCSRAFGRLDK